MLFAIAIQGAHKKPPKIGAAERAMVDNAPAVLWRDPKDIATRNLFYGPGGREHEPHAPFTFHKEDLTGSSPRFVVYDANGVKWKVKLGAEARPETAASRLVWAVGYFANEDYLVSVLRVNKMPEQLTRGQEFAAPDGSLVNARLKRYLEEEKKAENWHWKENPFTGTREFNGLRVMMALVNNWDLKDINTGVYAAKDQSDRLERWFMVNDLGASFATAGRDWPMVKAKGNFAEFNRSLFIRNVTPDYVDFNIPAKPSVFIAVNPKEYFYRLKLRWIGQHIPRPDARWVGQLLTRLSSEQIRDAFWAAGYSQGEVEGFARVIEHRITELQQL
jgi:hypothetical protein